MKGVSLLSLWRTKGAYRSLDGPSPDGSNTIFDLTVHGVALDSKHSLEYFETDFVR